MAKLTLTDGTIFEGTTEEIFAITEKFNGVKAEAEALKVGDYAKVIDDGKGDNGMSIADDIVVVTGVDKSVVPYNTKHLDGEYAGWHYDTSLRKATDEEVAEAKALAEQSAKKSVFTQAGRKPNEYRKGDIVVVTDNHCAGGVSVGDIVEVGKAHVDGSIFDAKHGYILGVSPLVFVENRLDK